MLYLQPISPENWRLDLKVRDEQKSYVANKTAILAMAYAYRNHRSEAFIIYNDSTPIGMVLYYDNEKQRAYTLSQFFIDYRYQAKGFGDKALKLIIEKIKNDNKYDKILLCYIEEDFPAKKFYEKHGFKLTGFKEEDEIEMVLSLR